MKILLFGRNGQLGWELHRSLLSLGELTTVDYPDVDFCQPGSVLPHIKSASPDVIVNAVAYTAVDQAEEETESAELVNAQAPELIAREARRIGATLIHYSTDYVFDGQIERSYTEADPPNPLNIYGRTKLAGERAVLESGAIALVLRTSWVYSTRRPCFLTQVQEWAQTNPVFRIARDQFGSPTWCRVLAEITGFLLACSGANPQEWLEMHAGLYHIAGKGKASRYDFAKAAMEADPKSATYMAKEIQPARSEEFPSPAVRPANSSLSCDHFEATFGFSLPPWQDALKVALESPE